MRVCVCACVCVYVCVCGRARAVSLRTCQPVVCHNSRPGDDWLDKSRQNLTLVIGLWVDLNCFIVVKLNQNLNSWDDFIWGYQGVVMIKRYAYWHTFQYMKSLYCVVIPTYMTESDSNKLPTLTFASCCLCHIVCSCSSAADTHRDCCRRILCTCSPPQLVLAEAAATTLAVFAFDPRTLVLTETSAAAVCMCWSGWSWPPRLFVRV